MTAGCITGDYGIGLFRDYPIQQICAQMASRGVSHTAIVGLFGNVNAMISSIGMSKYNEFSNTCGATVPFTAASFGGGVPLYIELPLFGNTGSNLTATNSARLTVLLGYIKLGANWQMSVLSSTGVYLEGETNMPSGCSGGTIDLDIKAPLTTPTTCLGFDPALFSGVTFTCLKSSTRYSDFTSFATPVTVSSTLLAQVNAPTITNFVSFACATPPCNFVFIANDLTGVGEMLVIDTVQHGTQPLPNAYLIFSDVVPPFTQVTISPSYSKIEQLNVVVKDDVCINGLASTEVVLTYTQL